MLPNVDEIKTRRIKLGLNQSSLAELTGISRASISKLENCKADLRYSRVKAVFDVLEELERRARDLRIVVCQECGALYDIHYIDDIEMKHGSVVKFVCQNCGMVPWVGKEGLSKASEHFKKR